MKYYDEMCMQCPDCGYYEDGAFPDGRPYKACRKCGYILHPEKGITLEACFYFMTPAQVAMKRKRADAKAKEKAKKAKEQ